MKPVTRSLAHSALALVLFLVGSGTSSAQANTATVVAAANKFLASLSQDQRAKVLYAFGDATQRARWSNFPTGMVPRGGISLKQMTAPQRDAAMGLMAAVLSPMGLQKVKEIQQADDDFKANGSRRGPGGGAGGPGGFGRGGQGPNSPPPGAGPQGPRPQGGGPAGPGGRPGLGADMFGSDLYYLSFLGTPSTTAPWMLQFGGHHLALNITIAGTRGVLTPSLTGAQPASFKLDGKTIRPVGRESDKALALLKSLSDAQRKQAILSYTVADLVLGPGQDGKKSFLKVSRPLPCPPSSKPCFSASSRSGPASSTTRQQPRA